MKLTLLYHTFHQILGIFKDIIGNNRNGNPLLGDITIRKDSPDKGQGNQVCTDPNMLAKLNADENSRNPELVLCDNAFKTNSINFLTESGQLQHICQGYFQGRQSDLNLQVLGGTLMRKYTQYKALVGKGSTTTDFTYRAPEAQQLKDNRDSMINAGSYYYFATELFWTWYCHPDTGRPRMRKQFSNTEEEQIETSINDAIEMVIELLDGAENDRQLFMTVYNKYFPRSDSDGNEPNDDVMGWSLSYMCLKMYSSGLPKMKLTISIL